MHGLSEKTVRSIQGVFAKHSQIEKAILYGSRAKGNYRNGSDIDLVLVAPGVNVSQLFKIELELDDLMLPYKIDFSAFDKIENAELIGHIDWVGMVFFEKVHQIG